MTQEANDPVDAEVPSQVDDGKISLQLAQSLLNEITSAKNELQATQRDLKETKRLLEKTERELEQIPDLQCQISDLQTQLKEKEKELQDTRAVLGQTTVENQRLRQTRVNIVAEPPNLAITDRKPSLKRARSPSLEITEISGPFIRRNRKEIGVLDAPKSSIKPIQSISKQKSASSDNVLPKEMISQASGSVLKDNEQSPPEFKRIKIEMMTRMESRAAETSREKITLSEKAAPHPSSSTTSQTQNVTQPPVASSTQQTQKVSASTSQIVPQPSSNQSTFVEKVPSILFSIAQNSTQPPAASLTQQAESASANSTLTVPQTPSSESTLPGKATSNLFASTSPSAQSTTRSTPAASSSQTEGAPAPSAQTTVAGNIVLPEPKESSNNILPSSSIAPTSSIAPDATPVKARFYAKIGEPMLPASTVSLYLEPCRTLTISPPPLDLQVPRKFISNIYGGNLQTFITLTRKNPSGPDSRRMVFPMLDLNPFVPRNPGEPGLIFASRHEILSDPPWTVFVKRRNVAPALWIYQGEYECMLCGTMTTEEFMSQTPLVQKRWAKEVHEANTYDVYVIMRARIALRKAGRIPVEDKDIEKTVIEDEMQAIKRHRGLNVSLEDIIAAFHEGDEAIDIIRMNCVKYDHVFANHMKANFLDHRFILTANKKKQLATGDSAKKKGKSASAQPSRTQATAEEPPVVAPSAFETRQVASTASAPEGSLRRSSRQRFTRTIYMED